MSRHDRSYRFRPSLRTRTKVRPKGCEDFGFEIKLAPVDDYIPFVKPSRMAQLKQLLAVVRTFGRFKIIQHEKGLTTHTTIRVGKEADVIFLILHDQSLIYRIYRYV